MEGHLIAAISALWLILSTFVGAVIKHLVDENKELRGEIDKLNEESKEMAKAALAALQKLGGGSS